MTKKQKEVLILLCQGYSPKEVADKLDIRDTTVESRLRDFRKSHNLRNNFQVGMEVERLRLDGAL